MIISQFKSRAEWRYTMKRSKQEAATFSLCLDVTLDGVGPLPLWSPPLQPLSYLQNNLWFTLMNEQWQRCPCDSGHRRCCCGNSDLRFMASIQQPCQCELSNGPPKSNFLFSEHVNGAVLHLCRQKFLTIMIQAISNNKLNYSPTV